MKKQNVYNFRFNKVTENNIIKSNIQKVKGMVLR